MSYIEVAKHYKSKGLSIIPINSNKKPLYLWYLFTTKIASDSEIEEMFKNSFGIGVITGEVSCPKEDYALLVVDIDVKNFNSNITYEQICNSIPKELLDKLFIVRTRSGGFHWYFYTPGLVGGNKKYAMRYTSEEERLVNPKEKVLVLIENRKNGGFVVSIPTEGYKLVSDVNKIPYLTLEESVAIEDAMCSFNSVINDTEAFEQFNEDRKNKYLISPFEDFNKRCDLFNMLIEDYKYTVIGNSSDGNIKMKRPGTSTSSHSGYYDTCKNRWINFSTSGEFESGKSYSACEVFNILDCEGDWNCCYRKLLDMGYGLSVDVSNEVNKVVDLIRNKNIDEVLKYIFNAEKIESNKIYKINNQTIVLK